MRKFFGKILGILFPEKITCVACGKEVFAGEFLCARCKTAMPYLPAKVCIKCGRKIHVDGVCENCKESLPAFDFARSVCSFAPPAQTLVHSLKFGGKTYLTDYLSEEITALFMREGVRADVVVGIPMSEKERRRRGFNQSFLLAEQVAKKTGKPYAEVLQKVKETKRQAKLGRKQREKNLKGAFRVVDRVAVKGRRVLIVDDVLTTGATTSEAAERLKRAGAKAVFVLTYCSVDDKNPFSTNKSGKNRR